MSVREIMSKRRCITPVKLSNEHVKSIISTGKWEEFQQILVNKEFRINRIFDDGHTSLSFAASKGNLDIVCIAIAFGAKLNSFERTKVDSNLKITSKFARGPLQEAVSNGMIHIAKKLIYFGASKDDKDKYNSGSPYDLARGKMSLASHRSKRYDCEINVSPPSGIKYSILKSVIYRGNIEEFKHLVKTFRINQIFPDGETALSLASREGNLDIILCAIANGAKVNPFKSCSLDELRNSFGIISKGALHVAVNCKLRDVVKELLSAGAQCDVKDYDGLSPIVIALQLNDFKTTEIFLNHGYPISSHAFSDNVVYYYIDFLEFLISKGLKISDIGEHCPLNLMIRYLYYHGPKFEKYLNKYTVMLNRFKNLVEKNAVAYERNRNNLLVSAFHYKLYEIVPYLIAGGAKSSKIFVDSLELSEGCFEALKSVYSSGSFITSTEFQMRYGNDMDNPELNSQFKSFMLWFETQEAKMPLKASCKT
jgi:ankyrin repeat protein